MIPIRRIEDAILRIRGERVMLDIDLAVLYGVETRALVQAVTRNRRRFPVDFMFQLSKVEFEGLRSQSVISKMEGRGGRRYPPYVFTEQGVAMLSSVLRSARAVDVNIEIMRVFVRLRHVLATHTVIAKKRGQLERQVAGHDISIRSLAAAIRQMLDPPSGGMWRRLGFRTDP